MPSRCSRRSRCCASCTRRAAGRCRTVRRRSSCRPAGAGYLEQARKAENTTAYRHYWELCTRLGLRDALRSGDVWVPGSRRYANPTTFLLPADRWTGLRAEYCTLVDVSSNADEALAQVGEQLHAALGELEPLLATGDGPVRMTDKGEIIVSKLSAMAVPDAVEQLRLQLVDLLPRPQLTELLIEVDRWASWSDQLTHAGGKTHRDPQLRRNLYAAILAKASNFGLTAMAEASGISHDTLAWTTEWYLREDTLRAANAAVVNQHHTLPLSSVWGGGTMSSSDGQRFPMRGKSLTARALSRYFVDEGVSTYTHVSDQHSTSGTKVIPVTDREAVYVLDEILGNATDLPITEHATRHRRPDPDGVLAVRAHWVHAVPAHPRPRRDHPAPARLLQGPDQRVPQRGEAAGRHRRRRSDPLAVGRDASARGLAEVRTHHRVSGGREAARLVPALSDRAGPGRVRRAAAHTLCTALPGG
jgi:hypothetical protein